MKENVGRADQILRAIVGPLLLIGGLTRLGATRGRAAGIAAMIGGALITETALTKTCPLNELLGMDTRGKITGAPHEAA